MKLNTIITALIIFSTVIFSQFNKSISHLINSDEDFVYYNNLNTDNLVIIDTGGSVRGLTQFYDYVTNGNNLKKLWVLGDTIIIACDYTDSLHAQSSSSRRTYYQASFDHGNTWFNDPIIVSNSYTAYPDLVPVISSGNRTMAVTGRGQISGGAYAAVDVILGAGAFIISNLPNPGSYGAIVSAPLSITNFACAYSSHDSLLFRTYNYINNSFSSNPLFISLFQTNSRYYIATNYNGSNIFVMWWEGSSHFMKGRESSNGGVTFGSEITIFSNSFNVEGDNVTAWFPADITYKPGTNVPCVVMSTLAEGALLSGQGCKVLFWSPSVNSGQPVKIADYHNMPGTFISDPNYFNSHCRNIQYDLTPLSHPSVAFSGDGSVLACIFSVVREDTSYYGFQYNNIYGSYSTNGGLNWVNPHPIGCSVPDTRTLCSTCDEIYPTLSKTGNSVNGFNLTYSLSGCPGSTSFINVTTPICKVYQVYKTYCPLTMSNVSTISIEKPKLYSLKQNYPNPFNPVTHIRFAILNTSDVKLAVYNAMGEEIKRIVEQRLSAGTYNVDFDGSNLASGVYFYTITAGDFIQTKKMLLVK
jgi:hypothetical protein